MSTKHSIIPRNLIIVFTNDLTEVALIKGNPDKKNWPETYNALGGHIEPGENIFDSAIRETLEESNMKIDDSSCRLCALIHIDCVNQPSGIMFVFKALTQVKDTTSSNEGEVEWVKLEDLAKINNIAPDLQTLIPLVSKLSPNEMIYGTSSYDSQNKFGNFRINTQISNI